jgi:hypothetical protein
MAFWYSLWSFGIVYGHFVYFLRFGMFGTKKNLTTLGSTSVNVRGLVKNLERFLILI